MEINGYELGSIVCMAQAGPLWATTTPDGHEALIQLRSTADAEVLTERWQKWARITHPHVLRLLDVLQHQDGRVALVVERLRGRRLDQLLDTAELRALEARHKILDNLKGAISALHDAGIIHGDISPLNIVVVPGRGAVLVDLADELAPESGTPGWSLEGPGGPEGDWHAWKAIARRLGIAADNGVGEGEDEEEKEVPAAPPATPEDAIEAMRRAALATPTAHPPKERRGRGRRSARDAARRRGLPLLRIAAAGAMALALGGGVARAIYSPTDQVPEVFNAEQGATAEQPAKGAPCPNREEIEAEIVAVFAERDRALNTADPSILSEVLAGEILQADQDLIRGLTSARVEVRSYHTVVEAITGVECEGASVRVTLTLRQDGYQRCEDARCRTVAPAEPTDVTVALDEGGKIAAVEPASADT